MDYKVENLMFYNMKEVQNWFANGKMVYEIENNLTEEEKIAMIDAMKDGVATYLLSLIKKWESEKETLPQNQFGGVKTVSEKAWIKRNDPRGIIDKEYNLGHYNLFGTSFKTLSMTCPSTHHGYSLTYTGQSVVHQWFHDLCRSLYHEEKKYFEENDPKEIKLKKVKELGERYHVYFDNLVLHDIIWNRKKDVPEEHLDAFINAYEKLEESIQRISTSLQEL